VILKTSGENVYARQQFKINKTSCIFTGFQGYQSSDFSVLGCKAA
jgi:hypothetical protein